MVNTFFHSHEQNPVRWNRSIRRDPLHGLSIASVEYSVGKNIYLIVFTYLPLLKA
jgi:hypothetical protein